MAAIETHDRIHQAREFIYGTIAVLIVISGIEIGGGSDSPAVAAIILAAAVATWVAHSYAGYMGRRLVVGHRATTREVMASLKDDSPIVLAALPAAAAAIGARLGFWSLSTALFIGNVLALVTLAATGWLVARASGASTAGAIVSTIVSTSIGLGIVAVQLLVHH
jgi:hypothetical protein